MTVTGDVLFAATTDPASGRGKLYALNRLTGEVLNVFSAAGMFGEPTWANGALYVGDSTGGMYELVPNPAGPQPDFDLELESLVGTMVSGGTGTFAATVIPKNGFNANVTLTATQIPSRSTAAFTPATVDPNPPAGQNPYSSQLALTTAAGTGPSTSSR
jgi:hypothetical protein